MDGCICIGWYTTSTTHHHPHARIHTYTHSCRRFLLDAHAQEPGFPVRVHSLGVGDAYVVSFPAKAAGAFFGGGGVGVFFFVSDTYMHFVFCCCWNLFVGHTHTYLHIHPYAPNT